MKNSVLTLSSDDNVGIVVDNSQSIPAGHKVAIKTIAKGAPIIKFGYAIGLASEEIALGEHVHIHNVIYSDSVSMRKSHEPHEKQNLSDSFTFKNVKKNFQGYLRKNGRIR